MAFDPDRHFLLVTEAAGTYPRRPDLPPEIRSWVGSLLGEIGWFAVLVQGDVPAYPRAGVDFDPVVVAQQIRDGAPVTPAPPLRFDNDITQAELDNLLDLMGVGAGAVTVSALQMWRSSGQ